MENNKLTGVIVKNAERLTSGFTQAGVYARRQFCADFQVCSPPEPLWNPRLREAATTLGASFFGQCLPRINDGCFSTSCKGLRLIERTKNRKVESLKSAENYDKMDISTARRLFFGLDW